MTEFLLSKGEDEYIDLDESDPYDRALKKYFEDGGAPDEFVMMPSQYSGIEEIDGKDYAILVNVHDLLGVYEFDGNGAPVEVEVDDDRVTVGGSITAHLVEQGIWHVDEDGNLCC